MDKEEIKKLVFKRGYHAQKTEEVLQKTYRYLKEKF